MRLFQFPSSRDSEVYSEAILVIIFAGSLLPFLCQHGVMVGEAGEVLSTFISVFIINRNSWSPFYLEISRFQNSSGHIHFSLSAVPLGRCWTPLLCLSCWLRMLGWEAPAAAFLLITLASKVIFQQAHSFNCTCSSLRSPCWQGLPEF